MNLIHVLILGIVEGITEFLPVSSTAHLILASKLLNISQTEFQKFFEVFIQSGAILAVVSLYLNYLKTRRNILKKIFFSFLPTAVTGFLFYKIIKNIFFESSILIVGSLLFIGVLFLLVEYLINNGKLKLRKSIDNLSLSEAIVIGLCQSLATVPGVSRAGIVIIIMIIMGYKRDEAAEYSFLLAIPTILAAGVFDLYKTREIVLLSQINCFYLSIGFLVSLITAYFTVKWLISYLKKNSLVIFGVYRILLSATLLFLK